MRLADVFKGKSGRDIGNLVSDTVVAELVEISSQSEVFTKIEEIKKAVMKSSTKGYLVVVYKA